MDKPLVSYIIPCYNQTRWLYEAVGSSILSYSGPKEIIIVNDSSNEPGWNIRLGELKQRFPEVVIINHSDNRGLSAARNTGLSLSKGEYIQMLDSDDILAPGKIDKQILHFNLVKNLSVSVTDYFLCDETVSYFYQDNPCLGSFSFSLHDFLYKWERGLSIPIHCALFHEKTLFDLKFNEKLFGKEDWVFWTDIALKGKKIAYLNIIGAIYRRHSKSMIQSNKRKMGDNWKKAVNIINEKVNILEPNFLEESLKWYKKYYKN